MPRVTPRTSEVGELFCGRRAGAGPRISAVFAGSPSAGAEATRRVHGLFLPRVSKLALIMLLCPLALMRLASGQIEVSAEVAIQARSQALGHKAKAVSPFADERRLVFRQPG